MASVKKKKDMDPILRVYLFVKHTVHSLNNFSNLQISVLCTFNGFLTEGWVGDYNSLILHPFQSII